MKRYRIYSEAGVDHGTWQGHDAAEALAAMHREAGYDVYADKGRLVFQHAADRKVCGDVEDWIVEAQPLGTKPQPGTQAAVIEAMGIDPLAAGGKLVDGQVFKPDADPSHRGKCGRCGRPGVWIAGAGEYLCARHQDDY